MQTSSEQLIGRFEHKTWVCGSDLHITPLAIMYNNHIRHGCKQCPEFGFSTSLGRSVFEADPWLTEDDLAGLGLGGRQAPHKLLGYYTAEATKRVERNLEYAVLAVSVGFVIFLILEGRRLVKQLERDELASDPPAVQTGSKARRDPSSEV